MRETDPILLARLEERVRAVQAEVHALAEELREYVTQHQFRPVQLLVYGLAGLLLSAVIAALVASVMR